MIIVLLSVFGFTSSAQDKLVIATFSIIDGDTFFMSDVPEVEIIAFKNKNERTKYYILKRRVIKVYPYALTAKEKCISDFSEATAVFILPSLVEDVYNSNFSIYPNPAANSISISNNESINRIDIYDIKGSLIFSQSYLKKSTSIDVSNFAKGVYSVKIVSMKNSIVQQLIIE